MNASGADTVKASFERDCLDALERLKAGTPTHKKLLRLKARNRLKITVRYVALEAGRCHTALYRHHQHIVELIRACNWKEDVKAPVSPGDKIRELNRRLQESEAACSKLQTHNQQLTQQVRELEDELKSERRKAARRGANPDNVTPFPSGTQGAHKP
jgi:predicted transcriptional regulator